MSARSSCFRFLSCFRDSVIYSVKSAPASEDVMALLLGLLLLVWAPGRVLAQQQQYDLIIRNGRIVDGTGSPWYAGDVAIRDGRIASIGSLPNATASTIVDAAGMVVAPGFIDMLGQSDLTILVNPHLPS